MTLRRLSSYCLLVLLASCSNPGLREGRELIATGQQDAGLARLEQAMRENPDDAEVRNAYYRQRELSVAALLACADNDRRADRLDAAAAQYRRAQEIDADNPRARNGLLEIATARRHEAKLAEAEILLKNGDLAGAEKIARTILTESPAQAGARALLLRVRQAQTAAQTQASPLKAAFAKPITLEFRDVPLRTVFELISRTAGINFIFDKDVRADTKVTIFVRNTGIDDVMRLILVSNQLERKMLNDNSVLIFPNTPAKVREHQELVVKSIYLANADVKQAQALLKTVAKTRDVFVDDKLNLLVIKDTADAVRLAEQLIESLDLAEPEVMLEVEVLEVSRSKLSELGVRFPDQIGYGLLVPGTSTTTGNGSASRTIGYTVAPGYVDLSKRDGLTSFVANPPLVLNLRNEDGNTKLLANPRIRVRNRDKAKIHIGDKLPVFTTTSTANVGVSASVTYLDIGLKLEVEPNVYLDDDVGIKVALEVSNVVKEVPGPEQSLAYQVGTRTANTSLRLKNGETQVLAGLISDEERSSANRVPGLGDLPLIGRLFSNQRDTGNKTEIVLLITPRIVRNVLRPESTVPAVPSGTETAIGAAAVQIKPNRGGSVAIGPSRPAAGAPPPPAVEVEVEPPAAEVAPAPAEVAPPPAEAAPPAVPVAPPAPGRQAPPGTATPPWPPGTAPPPPGMLQQ